MNDGLTISALQFFEMFPDAEHARVYLEKLRWDGKPACPHCGRTDRITARKGKRLGFYRCRPCKAEFTVRTASIYERSSVPLHKWLYAIYLVVTARKGISSLQLSKEIGVTQKTAWFLLGRLREACAGDLEKLRGTIEVDETFIGGKYANMHQSKRPGYGNNLTDNKTAVVGARQRGGRLKARAVPNTTAKTLQGFVAEVAEPGSKVFTDDAAMYKDMPNVRHASVKHSLGEYVRGRVHTNNMEGVWSVLKRSINGTWHHVSAKHLQRYIDEAAFRLNEGNCEIHTLDRMAAFVRNAFLHRSTYKELTA